MGDMRWKRPSRGVYRWLALGLTITLTYLLARNSPPRPVDHPLTTPDLGLDRLASPYLRHLASPLNPRDHRGLEVNHKQSYYILGEDRKVHPDYPHDYVWIDSDTRTPFKDYHKSFVNTNNAMARLPPGSGYDAVVLARGLSNVYPGEPDKSLRNTTIIGFFANYNPAAKEWRRAGPVPYVLDLPVLRQNPRPCLNRIEAGPEDPRLLWTDRGQLLVTIGTTSQIAGVCRSMAIVDLRVVWPGFTALMTKLGYGNIPIELDSLTEVGLKGSKEQYEKNWAPFFPGAEAPVVPKPGRLARLFFETPKATSVLPLFHAHVVPQTILGQSHEVDEDSLGFGNVAMTGSSTKTDYIALEEQTFGAASAHLPQEQTERTTQCLTSTILGFANHNIHQATPYYRVTMCDRGRCIPDSTNTLLFGIGHLKINWKQYRRFFMTLSVDPPHRVISVTKPVHLGVTPLDQEVIFAISATFFPADYTFSSQNQAEQFPAQALENDQPPFKVWDSSPQAHLGHGWLDDTLIISAGWRDLEMMAFHMPLATVLKGHHLCV